MLMILDGRAKYDVLIVIPPHKVPDVIRNSDLIRQKQKQKNWIEVDKFTLKTDFKNVYAIGDVTDIKVNETASIPKAGIFAEGEARTVSQQIIKEITDNRSSTPKFDGKGYCFMEVGDKKAGYIDVDFYNDDGPKTLLEPPSEDSYKKKIDFERSRVNDWLLL
jgi:sulfide:quinone oxidoreductase